jgi:hypothetical protein
MSADAAAVWDALILAGNAAAGRWLAAALWGLPAAALLTGIAALAGRRAPAGVRAWLWWLVALKLLLVGALWWLPAAALPLPAGGGDSPAARAAAVPLAALRGMGADDGAAAPTDMSVAGPSGAAAPRRPRPTPAAWLFLAFVVAGATALARTAAETMRLSRDLRRGSADLTDTPLGGEARLIGVSLGLAHTPRLRQSPAATAPLVFGLRAPAVVLPPDFSDALSATSDGWRWHTSWRTSGAATCGGIWCRCSPAPSGRRSPSYRAWYGGSGRPPARRPATPWRSGRRVPSRAPTAGCSSRSFAATPARRPPAPPPRSARPRAFIRCAPVWRRSAH